MANRYSQISTSQFDPLSLQEVLTVPLYKQKLYDQLEADRVATQEAFKVDPLDVHKDEAQRLQNNFNAKADELARYQLKTGDLQGAKTKMLDLRKEYKKLMDPMGNVSKINNANKTLKEEQARFLENASKQYGSARALELWNQHKNTYKGYDDKGNIQNINSRGIVANQDFMKDVKEFHDLMGKTTSSIAGSGYNIVERPEGLVMVNSSGKIVTNNNFEQLKSAEKALKSKWIQPTGEGTLYNIEAGKDPQEFENYFKNTMYSQRESSVTRDSDTNANLIANSKSKTEKPPMFNDAIQDPTTIKNLDKNTGEIDFKRIGTLRDERKITGYDQTTHEPIYGGSTKVTATYKNTLTPIQQKFYETAAKRLIRSGRLPKNADLNSTTNAEKIGFYMKNHMKFPTIASDIIRADVAIDNKLFSGNLASKDQTSRNRTLTQDLRQTEDGTPLRTMIDVETGKKVKFETGDKVDYLGVESPINYNNYGFENKFEQSTMAHRAQILDKDGNVKANVVISRTSNEMKDPTFKKMQEINQTYKTGLNNLGEWVRPIGKYSGSRELSKTRVKINEDNTFQIQVDGYGESPKLNNEQFIQQMQLIMEY